MSDALLAINQTSPLKLKQGRPRRTLGQAERFRNLANGKAGCVGLRFKVGKHGGAVGDADRNAARLCHPTFRRRPRTTGRLIDKESPERRVGNRWVSDRRHYSSFPALKYGGMRCRLAMTCHTRM